MAIPIYNSRQVARRLGVNLARWKRWSREFLPPDPLAGRQSGYARQYYLDDAFQVFLGGHLVSHLHFSVPRARQVLGDLTPWMRREGLRFDLRGRIGNGTRSLSDPQLCLIRIYERNEGLSYRVRRRLDRRRVGEEGDATVWEERWCEAVIGDADDPDADDGVYRTLRLSALIDRFKAAILAPAGSRASRREPGAAVSQSIEETTILAQRRQDAKT